MSELITALYATLFIMGIACSLRYMLGVFFVKVDGGYNERLGGYLVKPGFYFFEGTGVWLKYIIMWGIITIILTYAK
jgi:hypothetical protein